MIIHWNAHLRRNVDGLVFVCHDIFLSFSLFSCQHAPTDNPYLLTAVITRLDSRFYVRKTSPRRIFTHVSPDQRFLR